VSARTTALAVAVAASAALCCGGVAATTAASYLGGGQQPVPAACGSTIEPTSAPTRVGQFSGEQVVNAAVIVQVGQRMGVPPRGWVIAVATAMQESNLHNLGDLGARNDHDSLGLFQQRPSQGWGTPAQVMDPAYAARQFYQHLTAVPSWLGLPLTVAAQQVQRSAFPTAYAKHEAAAAQLVDAVSGGAAQAGTHPGQCATPGEVTAGGWVAPVHAPIVSGFRTPDRPTHQGVDLAAPRRTVIHAAAGGTVARALCDLATAADAGSCDVDGSVNVRGCGWYIDITHPDGIITRYCHLVSRPLVAAGDQVTAGQPIGLVGTSGNSSGPHCHFEVHTGGDPGPSGAVDPVPFMRQRGWSSVVRDLTTTMATDLAVGRPPGDLATVATALALPLAGRQPATVATRRPATVATRHVATPVANPSPSHPPSHPPSHLPRGSPPQQVAWRPAATGWADANPRQPHPCTPFAHGERTHVQDQAD
jgi:murein DD-endopeptidase MepM/ murein hydrolase activator NlpD